MSQQVELRVFSAADIKRLLTYKDCIEAVEQAMKQVSLGQAVMPLRNIMPIGDVGFFGMMPGAIASPNCFGAKLISLYPGNPAKGLSSHLGLYILYNADNGVPEALLEAGALTAIRTASATAVATRHLSRKDARRLAIIGTGEEAETHLYALTADRDYDSIVVWGRNADKTAAFVAKYQTAAKGKLKAAATIDAAVADADVICTVTAASTPILFGHMLKPGQHVNLVGASVATAQEADTEVVVRSRFFVDFRASAMAQAGEFLTAIKDGAVTADHIQSEIGEVIAGTNPGRVSSDEITVYKSLGVAAQDIAAAIQVLRVGKAEGQRVIL